MASSVRPHPSLSSAVDAAVRDLVRVRQWGDTVFVNLPLIFPGGSEATVRVTPAPGGFRVDDGGFAYRELESIGAERSFHNAAGKIGQREGIEVTRRAFVLRAEPEELARAICDVAMASYTVTDQVYRKAAEREEGEIEDYLRERLSVIFGAAHVEEAHHIKGSSTLDWDVSAIVHVNSHAAVFQAVGNHANSIYRASSAFRDLAELPNPPRLIAVVKDKQTLGPKLALLSQSGRVIQSDQTDDAYMRAAA